MKKQIWSIAILLLAMITIGIYSCSDGDDPESSSGTKDPPVLSSATDILTFTFNEQTGNAEINGSNYTVEIEVENGTDLTSLIPAFTLSEGATSEPASGTEGDYSSEVTITVTAEDGTTIQDWIIDVSAAPSEPSSAADILDFDVAEQTKLPIIDNTDKTISVEVANGTNLTTLAPVITVSPGATANPESGETGDYSSAFVIEVTAEDGMTVESWTVNVLERPAPGGTLSNETEILTFTIPDVTHHTHIRDGYQVVVFLEEDSDVTNSAATFTLSPGATANPPSGTPRDYSSAKLIFVTAEDGIAEETWQVSVVDGIDAQEVCYWYAKCQNTELLNECSTIYNDCIAQYGTDQIKACAIAAGVICD